LDTVPSLNNVSCIIEIHENCKPNLLSEIISRFKKTHYPSIIKYQHRDIKFYFTNKVGRQWVPNKWKLQLIAERYYPTPWLYLKPLDMK